MAESDAGSICDTAEMPRESTVLRRAITRLDRYLSRRNGMTVFSDDENCLLRIALVPATRIICLHGPALGGAR